MNRFEIDADTVVRNLEEHMEECICQGRISQANRLRQVIGDIKRGETWYLDMLNHGAV